MPTQLVAPLPAIVQTLPVDGGALQVNNLLPSPQVTSDLTTPVGSVDPAATANATPISEVYQRIRDGTIPQPLNEASTNQEEDAKLEAEALSVLVSNETLQFLSDFCSNRTTLYIYSISGEFPTAVPFASRLNNELTNSFVESLLTKANLNRLSRLTIANAQYHHQQHYGGSIIGGATNSIAGGGGHTPQIPGNNAGNINMVMNYTLGRKLGGGGFGDVFEAILAVTGGKVALKRIYMRGNTHQSSMEQLANISREVEVMAMLQHPNIVKFIAFTQEDPFHCIFMELCDGADLSKRLAAGSASPVATRDITKIINEIVSAVAYMHGNGVIHRDMKPQNILFRDGVAKVADFGTATKSQVPGAAAAGTMKGTLAYMAPENMLGERYDSSCDVWSLGCILAEILGVELPHVKSLSVHMLTIMYQEMTPADHILVPDVYQLPENVSTLIERCLHRDLAQRPTAEDILAHPICWDVNVAPVIREQVLNRRNAYAAGGAKSINMSIQSDDESGDEDDGDSSNGSMKSMVPSLCSTRQTAKGQKNVRASVGGQRIKQH
eukprot:GILI01005755.1.p1 GENE.GILI01005755.1~~GILI01005755.1.p1  ORF type:complete len:625 (+),score=125.68 GILI01005755.1:220-1875(+)